MFNGLKLKKNEKNKLKLIKIKFVNLALKSRGINLKEEGRKDDKRKTLFKVNAREKT